jgi:hypothetical protein
MEFMQRQIFLRWIVIDLEKETLEDCYKNHEKSHVRIRSQSLLLSNAGWKISEIARYHPRCEKQVNASLEKEGAGER